LNLYGFRLSKRNAYYHELFLRDHASLCYYMQRVGVKPAKRKFHQHRVVDPDFESMVIPKKESKPHWIVG